MQNELTCETNAFVSGVVLSSKTLRNSFGLDTRNSDAIAINF